jgi:hypothetical protein
MVSYFSTYLPAKQCDISLKIFLQLSKQILYYRFRWQRFGIYSILLQSSIYLKAQTKVTLFYYGYWICIHILKRQAKLQQLCMSHLFLISCHI